MVRRSLVVEVPGATAAAGAAATPAVVPGSGGAATERMASGRRHQPGVLESERADDAAAVQRIGQVLWGRLGPQHWWPADSAEEMIVGAVLTQAVAWDNAARVIARLKGLGLCALAALASCAPEDLAPLLREAGYFNAKARKLVAVARFFVEAGGVAGARRQDGVALRLRLLSVHGIGPETADAILCYALDQPAFVADAYARRVLSRIGVLPLAAARSYTAAAAWAQGRVSGDSAWLGELHALLVAVGKAHCRKGVPLCAGCPALTECAYARRAEEGRAP